jgi:hypothetical protein
MMRLHPLTITFISLVLVSVVACASRGHLVEVQENLNKTSNELNKERERSRILMKERNVAISDVINERKWGEECKRTVDSQSQEMGKLEKLLEECTAKLRRVELTPISECIAKLDSCEDTLRNSNKEFDTQRQEFEDQISRIKEKAKKRITRLKNEHKTQLEAAQERCRAEIREAESTAYKRGMHSVWDAIYIEGVSHTKGYLLKDYYLTIRVKVNHHTVFEYPIQTDQKERDFSRSFSGIRIESLLGGMVDN